jgi:hypothetical protein
MVFAKQQQQQLEPFAIETARAYMQGVAQKLRQMQPLHPVLPQQPPLQQPSGQQTPKVQPCSPHKQHWAAPPGTLTVQFDPWAWALPANTAPLAGRW